MFRVIKQEQESPNSFEKNNGKRITVPDQVQGLNEMLARFRRGEVPLKKGVYNNDAELPDLRKMDLTEVTEYKNSISKTIQSEKIKQKQIKSQHAQHEAEKRAQQSKLDTGDTPT